MSRVNIHFNKAASETIFLQVVGGKTRVHSRNILSVVAGSGNRKIHFSDPGFVTRVVTAPPSIDCEFTDASQLSYVKICSTPDCSCAGW